MIPPSSPTTSLPLIPPFVTRQFPEIESCHLARFFALFSGDERAMKEDEKGLKKYPGTDLIGFYRASPAFLLGLFEIERMYCMLNEHARKGGVGYRLFFCADKHNPSCFSPLLPRPNAP